MGRDDGALRVHARAAHISRSRPWQLVCGAAVVGVMLAGCGDDDDGRSAQEIYCDAGESLESSVTALSDLDVVAEGTDGLRSATDDVKQDVAELRDAATDAAADEAEALAQAVDSLDSAVSDLGEDISADNVTELTTAVQAVASSAQAVYGTLADCG